MKINRLSIHVLKLLGIQFPLLIPGTSVAQLSVAITAFINGWPKRITKRNGSILIAVICVFVAQASRALLGYEEIVFNGEWFALKWIKILLCIGCIEAYSRIDTKKALKSLMVGICLTCLISIYVAPAYILGYESLLPPGTCETNNIFLATGHMRCGSFGEGNYLGNFSTILMLLFFNNNIIFAISLTMIIISMSKLSLAIAAILTVYKLIKLQKGVSKAIVILITGTIMVYGTIQVATVIVNSLGMYEELARTSLIERVEFINIGIRSIKNYWLTGVGAGQFHNLITQFSTLDHLIGGSELEINRFIPNNTIIEILSEMGILGFIIYISFVYRLAYAFSSTNNIRTSINVLLLLMNGIAEPTYFILSNFVLYGLAFSLANKVELV